ncbi:CC0125/CC1285 family lipoprotein [Nitrospira sp. T9]|uniref:CC0125/CC1285 family lipoprotein n=1 Tax=unclassified Nitrospira TaxID=2652172 RepID=UPI003F955D89
MKQMFSLALVVFLAGCAIGRSYHNADNMWKLGYTDTQLNESVYRVSYAGYSIPQSEWDDFAIMRASEIAKEKGYKYFRILTEKQSAHSESFYVPGSTYQRVPCLDMAMSHK